MTTDGKALVLRLMEAGVDAGDASVVDEVCAEDFVSHTTPDQTADRTSVTARISMLLAAVGDTRHEPRIVLHEDDMVAVVAIQRRTHEGTFFGFEPAGHSFSLTSCNIFRIADGKIREHWGVTDTLALFTELGITPPPPAEG